MLILKLRGHIVEQMCMHSLSKYKHFCFKNFCYLARFFRLLIFKIIVTHLFHFHVFMIGSGGKLEDRITETITI